jgi:hypothetical protein
MLLLTVLDTGIISGKVNASFFKWFPDPDSRVISWQLSWCKRIYLHLISIYFFTLSPYTSLIRLLRRSLPVRWDTNYCLLEATLHFCTGYEANADHWHHDDSLLNFKFALDLIWWYIALGLGFRVNSPTQCVNVWAAVTGTVWLRLRLTWIIMMAQMIMIDK